MTAANKLSYQECTMIKHIKIETDMRSFLLIVVAMAGMSGILLDSWLLLSQYILLTGAAITLTCTILLWRNNRLRLASLVILWLLLGAWRYSISSPVGDPQSINSFIGVSKLEIRGTVPDDPKILDRSRLLL